MPNGPTSTVELGPKEIQTYIDKLKTKDGIIVENSVQDLLQASDLDKGKSLASYVAFDGNPVINELKWLKKARPEIGEISVEYVRWCSAFNRFLTAAKTKTLDQLPDVVQVGSTWVTSLADLGVLKNIEGEFQKNMFFGQALKSAYPDRVKGMFAAPWFVDTRIVFFWKDVLSSSALIDWQSFEASCQKTSAASTSMKGLLGLPLQEKWNVLHFITPFLWSNGGDLLATNYLGQIPLHRVLLDSPNSIEVIAKLSHLTHNGCIAFENSSMESLENNFLKREYASIISGPWFLEKLTPSLKQSVGAALPPKGSVGTFPFIGGSHLAVWHTANDRGNLEKALKLITFLTSAESQRRFSSVTMSLPANRETYSATFDFPYRDVYRKALESGRTYPPIVEWGMVVENEFVRNQLWYVWQAISQGQPKDKLEQTVKSAAAVLREKIRAQAWKEGRSPFVVLLCFVAATGGFLFWRFHHRSRVARSQLDATLDELIQVKGNLTVLQSQLVLWKRKEKDHSENREQLRNKLTQLETRALSLSKQLSFIREKQKETNKEQLGEVEIKWNGRMLLNNRLVEFENTNQAYQLIDHLVRQMARGITSISCLWGYVLFEWDIQKLQSMPNRLFNTTVAKINAPFLAKKQPPLLKSDGRNSWQWHLLWNRDLFFGKSDHALALDHLHRCHAALSKGDVKTSVDQLTQALTLDPRCYETMNALVSLPQDIRQKFSHHQTVLHKNLTSDIAALESGEKAVDFLLMHHGQNIGHKELLEREMISMRQHCHYLRKCLENLSLINVYSGQPLHLIDILQRLSSIRSEISALRSSGLTERFLWATVVESENFIGLMSIPKIQTLMNRFYNHEDQNFEDPRLIQLALVQMLSETKESFSFENTTTEKDFFDGFKKQIQRQVRKFESQVPWVM